MKREKINIVAAASQQSKLVVEASSSEGLATIRIIDRISEYSDNSANSIRALIDGFVSRGVNKATIYINSRGGSVFEASEIINELNKIEVQEIVVGAIAASAATRILVEYPGKVKAYATSQFMIHKPMMGTYGNEDQIEGELKMLKNSTVDYRQAYAKAFNMTEDEIDELWKSDYWMNATEAKSKGLIAEVIQTDQEIKAEDVALLEACGAPVIPEVSNSKSNYMDRDKLISKLGLSADATDEQIEAALDAAQTKAQTADTLAAEAQQSKETIAEALVNENFAKKKFTADAKAHWKALAVADYNGTKAVLDAMPAVEKPNPGVDANAGNGQVNAHKDWTLDDYLSKDPQAYEQLKIDNPARAEELERQYFNS
ncbi:ATP-dependent Clp protease proteolytic subunit [Faecalibacter macacae]|uniref:ATP-dependent Clp protease proteolytic subunit n=1 Tax=Faecalibacter macacae TaxID=1859289 RepID=UPI001E306781|nr:ATP-dependent Clp protease proteolytic subunit [Faecalibacter macacae]